jgi:hypothetical protein
MKFNIYFGGMSHADTMIQHKKNLQNLILNKASGNTISSSSNLIEDYGGANIILPK